MESPHPPQPTGLHGGAAAAARPAGHPSALWTLPAEPLAQHLQSGGAALFPTDTVPALAASPAQAQSLWRLKRRPMDKPLILMGADLAQLQQLLTIPWRESWLEMAALSWPGAVTLVLPIPGPITEQLHPGGHSLGLRVPACESARSLLRLCGPLATTSINRTGEPSALDALSAARTFPDLPLLAPLPWPACRGQASRVLAWHEASGPEADQWRQLRPGPEGMAQPSPPHP